MSQSISSTTFEQAGRWLEMLANAQDSGHWSKFEQKYRAFLGFVRAVANDPAAVEAVSMMIGDVETDPQGIASLKAIDAAVFEVDHILSVVLCIATEAHQYCTEQHKKGN